MDDTIAEQDIRLDDRGGGVSGVHVLASGIDREAESLTTSGREVLAACEQRRVERRAVDELRTRASGAYQ